MNSAMLISGLGARTAVGLSAPATYAAIRAGISGFVESDYFAANDVLEPIVAALLPGRLLPQEEPLWDRLVWAGGGALRECVESAGAQPPRTAVLLCVREPHRVHPSLDGADQRLLDAVLRAAGGGFHGASRCFALGNAAFGSALVRARELLNAGEADTCLVGGVDSLVNLYDLVRLERTYRLKSSEVAQGLVPGEGAVFFAVTNARSRSVTRLALIRGVGLATEAAAVIVLSDGHPTGRGLREALRAAHADSGVAEPEIVLRLSDWNGERYRSMESMLAASRHYRSHREHLEIWHPADCVGDMGAAAGPMLVALGASAMSRGEAPAGPAVCEGSSDGGLRAACVLSPCAAPRPLRLRATPGAARLVVIQHAEESAFLWSQRDSVTGWPSARPADISELDSRLEAHLDGLRVAASEATELVREVLPMESPGEVFARAMFAIDTGDTAHWNEMVTAVGDAPALARELSSALGWATLEEARAQALFSSSSPALRRAALGAWAIHRHDPGPAILQRAVSDADPFVRGRSLRAVGELRSAQFAQTVISAMADSDSTCRFWAGWSGAVLNIGEALPVLRAFAEGEGPFAERAADAAARRMTLPESNAWRVRLGGKPTSRRAAIAIAQAAGDPDAVPWLIGLMADPAWARPATFAFVTITGVDLARDGLEGKAPEGFSAGPTEDPDDDNVAPDPDEPLPWPSPERVRAWWSANSSRFAPGIRFFLGAAITEAGLRQTLASGLQGHRKAAALELAMRGLTPHLVETRARADRHPASPM